MTHISRNKETVTSPRVRQSHSGFTLIELAVVMVIVGLIAGGVLVAKDLIQQSRLKRALRDIEEIQTAVNTFRLKYNFSPGDFPNATTFWGTDAGCPGGTAANTVRKEATCDGNGNWWINDYSAAGSPYEIFRFWQHLANADMLKGEYTGARGTSNVREHNSYNAPTAPWDGGFYGVQYWAGGFAGAEEGHPPPGDYIMLGKVDASVPTYMPKSPILTPQEAFAIDKKIDDGRPQFGKMFAPWSISVYSPNCTTGAYPNTAYNTSLLEVRCAVRFYF